MSFPSQKHLAFVSMWLEFFCIAGLWLARQRQIWSHISHRAAIDKTSRPFDIWMLKLLLSSLVGSLDSGALDVRLDLIDQTRPVMGDVRTVGVPPEY